MAQLALSRSEGRKHFHAALTPVKGCGMAWFGDEGNLLQSAFPDVTT